jgi:hypothetical protein
MMADFIPQIVKTAYSMALTYPNQMQHFDGEKLLISHHFEDGWREDEVPSQLSTKSLQQVPHSIALLQGDVRAKFLVVFSCHEADVLFPQGVVDWGEVVFVTVVIHG